MPIKADRWIRRMVEQHGMIEPFEPYQVREQEGRGMISYGTSSYGYDVRCADEFKIFTNINSTIVDPKAFDARSFVDIKADVCIIPPNSFALARTVEYFRIPRNVLVVCLGKSTYARCFSGDTRVALVDGSAPTLEQMTKRSQRGEHFWGYSVGRHGQIIVSYLEAPRYIGRDALLEIELDNGERIRCTPDHQFMRRDGIMVQAHMLRSGSSLMPLYRKLSRGYESVYQPLTSYLSTTHQLADDWNIRNDVYEDLPNTHRHHLDHDRRNNRPWNIVRMAQSEHIRLHNKKNYGADFDPEAHSAAIKAALAKRFAGPSRAERYSERQRERAVRFWHTEKYEKQRQTLFELRQEIGSETRQKHRDSMVARDQDSAERERQSVLMRQVWAKDDGSRRKKQAEFVRYLRQRKEITADVVRSALDETGSIRGAARLLDCDRTVFRRFPEVVQAFKGGNNHKVTVVRELPGDHDVYCLTVPEAGNFALEAGVFVHNCGIIVNVTPLEPEWEGHVTLEFSNTTPLPAKIYANEGIAQVLFLESDEICETSYGDRAGKYQGQRGVTLPKT